MLRSIALGLNSPAPNKRIKGNAMIFLALCDDRPDSGELRASLLPTHTDHVVKVLNQLMLAAPFGPIDGLPMLTTTGLTGSIFGIEAADAAEAIALMRNDPYTGPVWQTVEVLRPSNLGGEWTKEGHVGKNGIGSGDGTYLLFSKTPPRAPAGDGNAPVLLVADLQSVGMAVGTDPIGYCSVIVIKADNLTAATAQARAIYGVEAEPAVMAVPVGLGNWVGLPSAPT
ncbi:MAG: YciI family protein [Terricaulis sp.]